MAQQLVDFNASYAIYYLQAIQLQLLSLLLTDFQTPSHHSWMFPSPWLCSVVRNFWRQNMRGALVAHIFFLSEKGAPCGCKIKREYTKKKQCIPNPWKKARMMGASMWNMMNIEGVELKIVFPYVWGVLIENYYFVGEELGCYDIENSKRLLSQNWRE